jgi:hypothetical protein
MKCTKKNPCYIHKRNPKYTRTIHPVARFRAKKSFSGYVVWDYRRNAPITNPFATRKEAVKFANKFVGTV